MSQIMPNPVPKSATPASLHENIAAYQKVKKELRKHHHALKWVLFYDTELIGVFDKFEDAAWEATRRYGRGPYLMRQVDPPPETIRIPFQVIYD